MQVVLWNAPDFFSIVFVIFVSDALVESRGQFVKKDCINYAKKFYFCCCVLQCFVNFNILPQDTQKSANQNLETVTPPKPLPRKTYRGETQSDIHRFPSSAWPPPPPPLPFGNTSKRYSAFRHLEKHLPTAPGGDYSASLHLSTARAELQPRSHSALCGSSWG